MGSLEKYYNALYSEKITLQSLAKNILVEGYKSVNFYKENNLVICEATHEFSNSEIVVYKYSFLEENLILLEKHNQQQATILYSREQEILNLKSKIIKVQQELA
ncbi:hypothetical protein [Enterococcus sp. AZ058]|uniref:hypothetical protein n=1 Tax=unclassified Enterococcus TaxID=2608891 RepID=UPI003D2ABFD7